MVHYEHKLLNALVDTYERSLLFMGQNKVNVKIAYPFTRKTLPDYFEESSLAYEEIHACVRELEYRGFLSVAWKRGKAGHIIDKVFLIEQNETLCYIREFSIRNFSDSKIFEEMLGSIARIMHRFGDGLEGMELSDILAEYNIYHTPNYVYFKGNIVRCFNICYQIT